MNLDSPRLIGPHMAVIYRFFVSFYSTIFLGLFLATHSIAHEGPAFPVLVNKKLAGHTVSIWADPDTGRGTFNVYLAPIDDSIVEITVESYPKSRPAHRLSAKAQKLSSLPEQQNFEAIVPFDSEENWTAEFTVKQKDGTTERVSVAVDVTPPGPSQWEFALYFLPFLLIGFVWGKAYLSKK